MKRGYVHHGNTEYFLPPHFVFSLPTVSFFAAYSALFVATSWLLFLFHNVVLIARMVGFRLLGFRMKMLTRPNKAPLANPFTAETTPPIYLRDQEGIIDNWL